MTRASRNETAPLVRRIAALDAVKGIAIVGVVCIHLGFKDRFDSDAMRLADMLRFLGGWSVLGFFFCAGFAQSVRKVEESLSHFVRRRALRLLVPCAFLSLTNRLLLSLTAGLGLSSQVKMNLLEWLTPAPPQFYFLSFLFFVSVVGEIGARRFTNMVNFFGAGSLLLSVSAAVVQQSQAPHGPDWRLLPIYGAAYGLGFVFADRVRRPEAPGAGYWLAALGVVLVPLVLLAESELAWLLVPPGAFLLLNLGCLRPITKVLAFLGVQSGKIFVWHAPILAPAIVMGLTKSGLNGWSVVCSTVVLAILGGIVIGRVVERFDRWRIATL